MIICCIWKIFSLAINVIIDHYEIEVCIDFLTYFKYKSQFKIVTRFQNVEIPVEPITSKKKHAIYELFINYL